MSVGKVEFRERRTKTEIVYVLLNVAANSRDDG